MGHMNGHGSSKGLRGRIPGEGLLPEYSSELCRSQLWLGQPWAFGEAFAQGTGQARGQPTETQAPKPMICALKVAFGGTL